MREKPKVLVLSKHLNVGGAERLLVDSLSYLDRNRFEYHFAYLLSGESFLEPRFQKQGFPVHCLGMNSNYHFPSMPTRLNRLQKEHRFDLLHAHLPLPGVLARLVGRWHRVPVVYTEHNLPERHHPVSREISRLTYGWNSRVFAVSQAVLDSLARLGWAQKTEVIPLLNGIPIEQVRAEAQKLDELRSELGIPPEHLIVGTAAILSRQKRLMDWLQVAHQVTNQQAGVTFVLAGNGPEEQALRDKVGELGLTDRVLLLGFRSDARRILGMLDIFLMTSDFEGLPVALLEAMALSKPVVVTPVGGIPEVVRDGQEGFLAPVGDIDALALHTMRLLNDSTLRQQMGQRNAQLVEEQFHMKDRIRRTEDVYLELLQAAENKEATIS